jgi:hypothetical protein
MPWTFERKYQRVPAAASNTASRGDLAWFLRTVAITILLLLALVLERRTLKWTQHRRLRNSPKIAEMQNSLDPTSRPML